MFSLQDWSANPMFERKDNKKEALLDLDGRVANLSKRYASVKDDGLKIQAMVAVRRCLGGPSRAHMLSVAREEGAGWAGGWRFHKTPDVCNL